MGPRSAKVLGINLPLHVKEICFLYDGGPKEVKAHERSKVKVTMIKVHPLIRFYVTKLKKNCKTTNARLTTGSSGEVSLSITRESRAFCGFVWTSCGRGPGQRTMTVQDNNFLILYSAAFLRQAIASKNTLIFSIRNIQMHIIRPSKENQKIFIYPADNKLKTARINWVIEF